MSTDKGSTASVEELYLQEKKKASILMVSVVVLAVLLVGSVMTRPDSSAADSTATQNTQQRGAGGRGGQSVTEFFDESGAVDQDAVDVFASRATQGGGPAGANSSQFLERFTQQIDTSIESGEITQAQGDALQAAFDQIESGGN